MTRATGCADRRRGMYRTSRTQPGRAPRCTNHLHHHPSQEPDLVHASQQYFQISKYGEVSCIRARSLDLCLSPICPKIETADETPPTPANLRSTRLCTPEGFSRSRRTAH